MLPIVPCLGANGNNCAPYVRDRRTNPFLAGVTICTMRSDLKSLGFGFERWQEAVEAAIATDRLSVFGEVRGGQLVRYDDPSGAQLYVLGVEPFNTYAGFTGDRRVTAHVSSVDDVLALIDITDDVPGSPTYEDTVVSLTCNLAQGPMLVEAGTQSFEQVALTGLALQARVDGTPEKFSARTGHAPGTVKFPGAEPVLNPGSGTRSADATAEISAKIISADKRSNALTGQEFWHVTIGGLVPMDLTLPSDVEGAVPAPGAIVSGSFHVVGEIIPPAGCGGDSGGCGSGSCGCGGH